MLGKAHRQASMHSTANQKRALQAKFATDLDLFQFLDRLHNSKTKERLDWARAGRKPFSIRSVKLEITSRESEPVSLSDS